MSAANAGSQIVALLLLPLFTSYLSPEEFGIISMVSTIVTVMALIYNPGIMSASMRLFHATKSETERKLLIGSAYKFFMFIPILPLFLGFLWGEDVFSFIFKSFDFYPYGALALVLAFFIQPSRMWLTLMTLQYKIEKTAFVTAIAVILGSVVSVLLIVSYGLGAMGRVLGMFVPAIFLYAISYFSVKRYTDGSWSSESIKMQLKFGIPLVIGLWAYQGLSFFGKFFLEKLGSLEAVGIYTVGVTLAGVPMFMVMGFKQLWSPVFYENMNNNSLDIIRVLIKYFTATISLLTLFLILFNGEIVIYILDEKYYSVISIIPILLLGTYFNGLLTISNSFLSYNNRFHIISIFGLIATILNVLLNILLIPLYGIVGASLSALISYFIFYVLGVVSEKSKMDLVQDNVLTFVPPAILIVGLLVARYLDGSFSYVNSGINIFLKFLYLVTTLFVFFRLSIIERKDFHFIKRLLSKKR